MTTIKKTLVLLTVLVMAMTILALPASAITEDDVLEPCANVTVCPSCESETYTYVGKIEAGVEDNRACHISSYVHAHTDYYMFDRYVCTTCGYTHKNNPQYLRTVCSKA